MRKFIAAAAIAAAIPTAAFAQDADTTATATVTAPDGTPAFGIEPYFGVMGGYERFDNEASKAGLPTAAGRDLDGGIVQGVIGVNIPLGPVFIGAEANGAKGFRGDIGWEYGAAGRFGFRAGDSGLIYGKVGYQWVKLDGVGNPKRHYHDMTYGIGLEVGPKDIGLGGITGNSGIRLRLEVNTFGDFHSARPMAGVIAHF
ncbi:opacity protein [Sphingomonas sp. LB-2]|uniref:opacity protein n=1 Tax=Sphingomonas caeni TaxID=2984949 RepID=UPI00222F1444|nr:opacity protein [Sphingomonas caeni]MCW3847943.1 opacity protein [Sphingomonas caeni]